MSNRRVTEHILDRQDCHIHYWLTGPVHRPLIVFTHGAAMDHRMFEAQVAAAGKQYRVLVWDVPGHGHSQPMPDCFSIHMMVEHLAALLDEVGYEQAILVGHSMGGYVSQDFLFLYPERVIALVMIGCTGITLQHPLIIAGGMYFSTSIFGLIPYSLLVWLASRYITVTPGVRAYVQEVLGRHSKKEFLAIWSAVMNCLHYEPDYRIHQPVLVTHGKYDYLGLGVMAQQAKAWAKRDPNCRYVAVPAAGHNAQQENPTFFNKILLDFMDGALRFQAGKNSVDGQAVWTANSNEG